MGMKQNNNQNQGVKMTNQQLENELMTIAAEGFADLLASKGANANNITPESIEKIVNDNWGFIQSGMNKAVKMAVARG